MAALRTPTTRIRLLLAALVLAAALLVVMAPVFMLAMAPAIALFAIVVNRVMPGEDAIVRLRSAHVARRRRPVAQRPVRGRPRPPRRPADRRRARHAASARAALLVTS